MDRFKLCENNFYLVVIIFKYFRPFFQTLNYNDWGSILEIIWDNYYKYIEYLF